MVYPVLEVSLPIRVLVGKKYFPCNLNEYRNAHHRVLADAKKNYAAIVYDIPYLKKKKIADPVVLCYRIYAQSKRGYDVANISSIVDKFACDALVDCGVIPDDNYKHVKAVIGLHGGVDRENPRAVLSIYDYEEVRHILALFQELN